MLTIFVGLFLILSGVIVFYNSFSGADWAKASGGWATVLIGTLTILYGFGKRINDRVSTPHQDVTEHANIEMRALIQSMSSVAFADNTIRELEMQTIVNIYDQMLGMHITQEEVRETLEGIGPDFDITGMLSDNRSKISPAIKRTIVQCYHLVMTSDKEIVSREQTRINEIGLALGFDQTEVEDMISSAGL